MKDYPHGDFIQISKDWKLRQEAIKRQSERDLSRVPKIKLLVQGRITKTVCYLNEVWQYLIHDVNVREQIEEFTERQDPTKSRSWSATHERPKIIQE